MVSTTLQILKSQSSPSFSFYEKSHIERAMQYIRDRTENFDNYFPCRLKSCKLKQNVRNWLRFFDDDYYNKEIKPVE